MNTILTNTSSLSSSLTSSLSSFANSIGYGKIVLGAFVAILCVYIGYSTYKQYANSKTAFHIHDDSNGDKTGEKTATLMLFYADWCPHCNTAKPEWESLKSKYENKTINGFHITFVEYNCTTETDETAQLMGKYNIEGFPTIKLIKGDEIIECNATPTIATMEDFLNEVL